VTILCAPSLAGSVYAQGADTSVLKLPQDIEFKGPLSGPPQTVVLATYMQPTTEVVAAPLVNWLD